MDTTTTDSSTSSTSPPSTGGTTATQDPVASTDFEKLSSALNRLECQKQQSTDSAHNNIASDDCDMAAQRLQHLTGLSSPSRLSSPTSGSHVSSPPFLPKSPLRSLVETCSELDPDSGNVSMQSEQPFSQQRSRMLSAPLPSVPPSTPSSTGYRVSQSHNYNALLSPPSGLLGSPRFIRSRTATSPLVRHRSDSQHSHESDVSDAPSVEIISADIEDSFVTGRFEMRDGSMASRGNFASRHSPIHMSASQLETTAQGVQGADSRFVTARPLSSSQSQISRLMYHELSPQASSIDSGKLSTLHSPNSSLSSASRHSLDKLASSEGYARKQEEFLFSGTSAAPEDPDVQQPAQDLNGVLRTPNVYINGLPPHFSDESLYAMTRDFGHVLSVRTFTRCVGEKMSGYGFVLFDSVEGASRCIETLRKYRNLHPSFSKQVHKIPGTPYASGAITIPPAGSMPSLPSQHSLSSLASFPSLPSLTSTLSSSTSYTLSDGLSPSQSLQMNSHRSVNSISDASATSSSEFEGSISFREKMERLKDEKSTNLYMEGLPLSIDDVSLAALVSPYKVVSRRFFQTKLSDPPRMIAFVRMETRTAAEEVIERLHGRVVRGWNDNGCRISVRFADTNEQRELRRSERLARGEDEDVGGAGRLSMAHAALINLRGAEVQSQMNSQQHHVRYDDGNLLQAHSPPQQTGCDLSRGHTISNSPLVNTFTRSGAGTSQRMFSPNQRLPGRNALPSLAHADSLTTLDISAFHPSSLSVGNPLTSQVGLSSMGHPFVNGNLQPSLSAKALEASRLALLQQEAQLKQLQLLQQMQNLSEHDTHSLNALLGSQLRAQNHALMPSASIRPTRNDDHFGGEAHLPSTAHYSQATHSKTRSRDKVHFSSKGEALEGGPADTTGLYTQSPSSQIYHSIFGSPKHTISQGDTPLDHRSPGKAAGMYSHAEEMSSISPALTFASRTPSTMSPATPFFSTFGTPASAPAAFPKRKASLHDQDYRRTLRNDAQS